MICKQILKCDQHKEELNLNIYLVRLDAIKDGVIFWTNCHQMQLKTDFKWYSFVNFKNIFVLILFYISRHIQTWRICVKYMHARVLLIEIKFDKIYTLMKRQAKLDWYMGLAMGIRKCGLTSHLLYTIILLTIFGEIKDIPYDDDD